MHHGVFFDRDDTLIHCGDVVPDGDLGDPALVALMPGALEACRVFKRAGFALVVVSNQGGVARGKYTTREVDACNARLNELLDGLIDRFYYCPWHPKGVVPEFAREHPWRKPQPGMLLQGASDLGLDLARSWMIGDAERDVEAGQRAGCSTVHVLTAPANRKETVASGPVRPPTRTQPAFTAPDLRAGVEIILRESRR